MCDLVGGVCPEGGWCLPGGCVTWRGLSRGGMVSAQGLSAQRGVCPEGVSA